MGCTLQSWSAELGLDLGKIVLSKKEHKLKLGSELCFDRPWKVMGEFPLPFSEL